MNIDVTAEAARYFKKHFEMSNTNTLFLNGKWGSGKTTFLKEIFKYSNKKQERIYFIDLWRRVNNLDTFQIFYRKIYPVSFYCIKYLIILLSIIFLFGFYLFANLEPFTGISISLIFLGIIATINVYLQKVNFESLFFSLLKIRSKIIRKRKLIVIDDFDRIDPHVQDNLYKIFNALESNNIKFIFVGDYNFIYQSNSTYLQKIIEERIELPYLLQPTKIWNSYFDEFLSKTNNKRTHPLNSSEKELIEKLFSIAVKENRVLRELELFKTYVHDIYFNNKKYDRVNSNQQLAIIYLYCFHYEIYQLIVNEIEYYIEEITNITFTNAFKKQDKESTEFTDLIKNSLVKQNTDIIFIIESLFIDSNLPYPSLLHNHAKYLINFVPNNLGSNKIIQYIENQEYEEIVKLTTNEQKEFYHFINRNKSNFQSLLIDKIVILAFYIINNSYDFNYFFKRSNNEHNFLINICLVGLNLKFDFHSLNNSSLVKLVFDQNEFDILDLSQKIRVCSIYFHLRTEDIFKLKTELVLKNIEDIDNRNFMHPSILFVTAIDSLNNNNEDLIKKAIANLNDDEFLYFLYYFSHQRNNEQLFRIRIPDESIYNLVNSRLENLDQDYLIYNFELESL